MANSIEKILADFIQAERNIYAQCPECQTIHRLNEYKIFYGKKPPKDLLDQLREAAEKFEERKKKIIEQSIEKSKQVYIGKTLEHLAPMVATWGHKPRDCRFLAEPIDFIAFDGLFEKDEVNKITFIEAKTGNAKTSPRVRLIVKAGSSYERNFALTVGLLPNKLSELPNESINSFPDVCLDSGLNSIFSLDGSITRIKLDFVLKSSNLTDLTNSKNFVEIFMKSVDENFSFLSIIPALTYASKRL